MRPRGRRVALLLAGAVALGAFVFGCGGGDGDTSTGRGVPKGQAATDNSTFSGGEATPPKPAPPLALSDYLGDSFNLKDYRGKVVLLTFIYTHCPDVCPLIVSHLKTARAELAAKAKDLQIVAVSTDPRGDTANTVAAFLKAHAMTGKMKYLLKTG